MTCTRIDLGNGVTGIVCTRAEDITEEDLHDTCIDPPGEL